MSQPALSATTGGRPALLVLFDIDGTLLHGATRAHRDALHTALLSVHGVDARGLREPPSPAGRTDNEIGRLILRAAGVPEEEIDRGATAVREECCRVFAETCEEDLTHTVIEGVPELLTALAAREGEVHLGLLTGNFEPIARRKLAAAGVGEFFTDCPGGFGSDSEDRRELPPVARRRAGDPEHPRERTLIVGDTPRDIACARADRVRCVAVTTGEFTPDELHEADAVARGPVEVGRFVEALLAG